MSKKPTCNTNLCFSRADKGFGPASRESSQKLTSKLLQVYQERNVSLILRESKSLSNICMIKKNLSFILKALQ